MEDFSQNGEQLAILNYFGDFVGTFLDCGANTGVDLSNTYALVLKGWAGTLIEASPRAYQRMYETHSSNQDLVLLKCAIGSSNAEVDFYESGELLGQGDIALVSTTKQEETKRWASLNMPFNKITVPMLTFETVQVMSKHKHYDFISIDIEGSDLEVLKQIDLSKVGCKCLCIEHNGVKDVLEEIRDYCKFYGLTKELTYNAENIILAYEG